MNPGSSSPRRVQSLDRALDVLKFLSDGPQRLTDIALATGSSKAAIHHILATLQQRRLVTREEDSVRYRLGWGVYELGARMLWEPGLSTIIAPRLSALAEDLGEAVLFSVEESGHVLVLMREEAPGRQKRVAMSGPGKRIPVHATASGKIMLAYKPALYSSLPDSLTSFTPCTITDPEMFKRHIETVKMRGYSTCWDERVVSLSALSVPVFGRQSRFIGAVAVTAPSNRLNRRNFRSMLRPLIETRDLMHQETGGSLPPRPC